MPSAMMQRPSRQLHVDFARHEVWDGRREIELTNREWQLLALLVEKPGHPVTTDEILESFYGEAWAELETRSVSQHLARLRRKIGPERVETIGGRGCNAAYGYRFSGAVRKS